MWALLVVAPTVKIVVHAKEMEVKAVDFVHHDARLTATSAYAAYDLTPTLPSTLPQWHAPAMNCGH